MSWRERMELARSGLWAPALLYVMWPRSNQWDRALLEENSDHIRVVVSKQAWEVNENEALYLSVNVFSTKELELRTLSGILLHEAGPRLSHKLLGNFWDFRHFLKFSATFDFFSIFKNYFTLFSRRLLISKGTSAQFNWFMLLSATQRSSCVCGVKTGAVPSFLSYLKTLSIGPDIENDHARNLKTLNGRGTPRFTRFAATQFYACACVHSVPQ